ncbi:MAG: hypothetical protein R3229_05710 [Alphaproteobacteria bacterium]|nr:hypothetical protein [Alphaproteobacteria bacterium]
MTPSSKKHLRFAGLAASLAIALSLFAAPAANAGDRGSHWSGDRGHRIERHVERDRHARRDYRKKAHRRAHRDDRRRYHRRHGRYHQDRRWHRHHNHRRHHRHVRRDRDFDLAPVIAGIGLGIVTYAILNNHQPE